MGPLGTSSSWSRRRSSAVPTCYWGVDDRRHRGLRGRTWPCRPWPAFVPTIKGEKRRCFNSSSIFCGSVCKFNALAGGQWSIRPLSVRVCLTWRSHLVFHRHKAGRAVSHGNRQFLFRQWSSNISSYSNNKAVHEFTMCRPWQARRAATQLRQETRDKDDLAQSILLPL